MTRVARHRERAKTYIGSARSIWDNTTTYATVKYTNTCDDYVGRPTVPSPLNIFTTDGIVKLNGRITHKGGVFGYDYTDWPLRPNAGGLNTSPLSAPPGWTLDLVAGTNPSRPTMTPLTLLQDLIDIPSQIRQLGNLFKKPKSLMSKRELANHYLCVQFGWLPLFDDLKQILDLQSYILKRIKELEALSSGKGLRRRLQFDSDDASAIYTELFGVYATCTFSAKVGVKVSRKSWGTCIWTPDFPLHHHPSDVEMNALARRLVLGLTVEGMAKGLWDVFPWTWLLGWFSNIGKFTLANSNTVPATPSALCFMSKSVRTYNGLGVINVIDAKSHDLRVDGQATLTTSTRITSSGVMPGVRLPFLSSFRLSILGSLFVQRAER